MKYKIKPTHKYPLGAYCTDNGIRVSAEFKPGKECGIILFLDEETEPIKIAFPEWARTGRLVSGEIISLEKSNPFLSKDGRGVKYLLFEGEDIYLDPYMCDGCGFGDFGVVSSPKSRADISELYEDKEKVYIANNDCIYYMLHVRGYTAHKSSKVSKPGTYQGLISKLGYIRELGATSIILMPVYEFNEIISNPLDSFATGEIGNNINFWGYTEGYYFKPKASFAATNNPNAEFRKLVSEVHKKGMEIILQFWFPDAYSSRKITDVLRFWKNRYCIDGFQLIGSNVPVDDICLDPELYGCKVITEFGINITSDNFNPNHCSIDSSYMIDLRKFLKGDPNSAYQAALRLKTSDPITKPIGFIARQDTMRALDLVSYNEKHNEANGENGRDGADYNFSWNCGYEGITRKKTIISLRERQLKNAWALTLFGQATPLIYGGDEFANTQLGNNNPYNQDNDIGYIKWTNNSLGKEILDFVKQCIKIRNEHPIIHCGFNLTGRDFLSLGYPDVSLHGEELWRADLGPTSHCFGILYFDKYADSNDDRLIYIIYNMHWEEQDIALPKLKSNKGWNVVLTNDINNVYKDKKMIHIAPRSFIILEGI